MTLSAALRRASDVTEGFPYGNPMIAFVVVEGTELRQVNLGEARTLARGGRTVYGAWPGTTRTDVFVLDTLKGTA